MKMQTLAGMGWSHMRWVGPKAGPVAARKLRPTITTIHQEYDIKTMSIHLTAELDDRRVLRMIVDDRYYMEAGGRMDSFRRSGLHAQYRATVPPHIADQLERMARHAPPRLKPVTV